MFSVLISPPPPPIFLRAYFLGDVDLVLRSDCSGFFLLLLLLLFSPFVFLPQGQAVINQSRGHEWEKGGLFFPSSFPHPPHFFLRAELLREVLGKVELL